MISSTLIKSIQDIMRQDDGVDGDAQRLSQLVWMVFLKILDDSERELELLSDSYVSALPARYQWRAWAGNDEGLTGNGLNEFVNNNLFPALRSLKASGNSRTLLVREAFEDSHNYMKSGVLLRQVINLVNSIDFNVTSDKHQFNELYEGLLRELQAAGNAGEYYTPRALTQFIVQMIQPRLGDTVYDPACGTGGFLSNAIEYMRGEVVTAEDEALLQRSIRGTEKKQLPHVLCLTNMLLHGFDAPTTVRRMNTLARPIRDYGPGDRIDVVVTNPPFGGIEEPGIEQNFPQSLRTRETADLFLVLIIRLLKPGGRAGIVLPDGTLFGEGVKTRIKEHWLRECNVHTIVRLPPTVFAPYTTIATNMIFFDKGSPTKETWYWEHTLPVNVKSYSKTKPILPAEFDPLREWWNNRQDSPVSWRLTIDEIVERSYNLDVRNPHRPAESVKDPEELLVDYEAAQSNVTLLIDQIREILSESWDRSLGE